MSAIHLDRVCFSYSSAVEVFDSVSVHLGPGWTGVVGPNGSGKSTLLSLISGESLPSRGHLVLDPAGAAVTRCPQEVDESTPEIEAFASATDGVSRAWMGRLEIEPDSFRRWPTLSPGERKRWQLGAALASHPNILLLDEPTNHLDPDVRKLVEDALARFEGVGLVISHDRGFLDSLTVRTLRVGEKALRLWSAPYTTALEAWTAEEESLKERLAAMRKEEKTLKRRLAKERRDSDQREARFRRSTRTAGPKDHDARSMAAKGRHAAGSASGQRRRGVLRASLGRTSAAATGLVLEKDFGGTIFFDFEPSPKRRLMNFSGPLTVGSRVLAPRIEVEIHREDRIRLVGPNGAGKSTLLRALVEDAAVPPDRLLYLPQELTRDEGTALLERLVELSEDRRGRVLAVVAALGVNPEALLVTQRPSPGEARKLAMALGLGTGAWMMALDEPTNHLDLPAVERIESALEAYPGALLMITHDETFAPGATSTVWRLDAGVLSVESRVGKSAEGGRR